MYVLKAILLFSISDIDECFQHIDGCSQTCSNNQWSFICTCSFGFIIGPDNKNCIGWDYFCP